jgi:type I restriction enzyme S subunit
VKSQLQHRRLKFVATLNDESLSESTDPDYELEYIDIGNVDSLGRVNNRVTYKFAASPSRARRKVANGDVIISTVRTYLQAIAPIENPEDNLIVSTGFAVARPNQDLLDPRYFKYALRVTRFLNEVVARSTGISYPAINSSELADIRICTHELEVQRDIASYLDRETAQIDALISEKERMLILLEQKRVGLISRTVTSGLNPNAQTKPCGAPWFDRVPSHWSVMRLKWIIESVSSGVSVNATDQPAENNELGILKTSSVLGGKFFPEENKAVWATELNRLACPVTANSVIMSRMNTPSLVAESGLVTHDYPNLFLPDRLWKLKFIESVVHAPYVAMILSSKEARHALSSRATGTSPSMKNLAIEEMSDLAVPIPPLAEQKAIVTYIQAYQSRTAALESALRESISLLKDRRSALISAAVTGQLTLEITNL